jgi:uncharacterized protein GlcG (DUF336 family)
MTANKEETRMLKVTLAAAAFAAIPAMAQSAPVPAATMALPGDMFGTGQMPPPPPRMPANAKPGTEAGTTAAGPGFDLALKAAQTALETCRSQGFNVGVAVVDSVGQPRVGLSADGANGGHIYTAVRKALAALATGGPSGQAKAQPDKLKPTMVTMAGAVPIFSHDGKLIGAIGASGAASTQDEACAKTGLEAIKAAL